MKADKFLLSICDLPSIERTASSAFYNGRKGELFVEYRETEFLKIENGVVQTPNFTYKRGFGLRSFEDEASAYSYSSSLDERAVKKALEVVKSGTENSNIEIKSIANDLYDHKYFINSISLEHKIKILQEIDSYARGKSENIRQVIASLESSWQVVSILTNDGKKAQDIRPLIRLSVHIVVEKGGICESGTCAGGGRFGYEELLRCADPTHSRPQIYVDEALRQAEVKLQALKAPAGEMPVVLGNAWTGILLHEAIGHGLEGDSIYQKTSLFHNLLGEMIAAPNITVVDDGTLLRRRGSINIDDEGTDSRRTVLIENGKLVGFLQDRQSANLLQMNLTGNGRRESYEFMPIPRMTNTFMLAGNYTLEEMIARVQRGIFAKSFSDGQVNTASGKFVFSASEAYLIENGKITAPLKGAMLIGDGPSILKKISMLGNDFSLDTGIGTCGKEGQWVPVGVGEPSVLLDRITVGGANL
jgi:TldD protein